MEPVPWWPFIQLVVQAVIAALALAFCIHVIIASVLSAAANYRRMFKEKGKE